MKHVFAAAVLTILAPLVRADIDAGRLARIDAVAAEQIRKANVPGAVIVVVHDDAVVYRKAFGHRQLPDQAMPFDAVFDMASLTKPIATGTSVAILVEQGKIKITDPVAKYWPAFAANGKEGVTVEHCLLHTAGLIPDNSIKDYVGSRDEMLARVADLKLEAPPGTRFKYSDVGFIVLGELVTRISGKPLDGFAKENVFQPLKLTTTGYKPAAGLPFAVSGVRDGKTIAGVVHDPRAFALGGVAGHAGLFSTADDVTRYCRMLLRGGELDGVRILSPLGVKWFTDAHAVPGGQRSYGWDVDTSYSGPRGDLFPAGDGFGHTGFTGTSVWIDPPTKTAIIILTNRLHPDEKKGNAAEIRRQVANVVASALTNEAGRLFAQKAAVARPQPVLTGIDVLRRDQFASLKGKNVGLVTNHTGRAADCTPTIDLLAKADGVKVVALFSPEHGIRGEKDEKVGDGKDEQTGLPVFSLYGDRRKPTAETLKGVDTLVYDIQDIGCRFYTYSSTLGLVLEAAKENNLRVVVLDRPNPIGGVLVEGPVRDDGRGSFVGYHDVPVRHGLTVGEMAKLFNAERKIGADLTVIKCENWRRGDTFDRTDLPWRNPSPNMRHLTAAMLYPGVGLLETTNVSVGRGTERPFEWIGAPYIDGRKLAAELNRARLPGVRFVPTSRVPTGSTFKDKECGGVDIIVDGWDRLRPVHVGLTLAATLRKLHAKEWETKRFDTLLLHKATHDNLLAGVTVPELEKAWQPEVQKYLDRRAAVLLYEE